MHNKDMEVLTIGENGDWVDVSHSSPDEIMARIKRGLLQALLALTYDTIKANASYFCLDDAIVKGKTVTEKEMMDILYTSIALLQARLDEQNPKAQRFINSFTDKQQQDLIIFTDFIFNKMPDDRKAFIKNVWRNETDADNDEWQEIQALIARLKN